jgi:hypothetical protein
VSLWPSPLGAAAVGSTVPTGWKEIKIVNTKFYLKPKQNLRELSKRLLMVLKWWEPFASSVWWALQSLSTPSSFSYEAAFEIKRIKDMFVKNWNLKTKLIWDLIPWPQCLGVFSLRVQQEQSNPWRW